MTEAEMKLHRVCFTGHRPDKLIGKEKSAKQFLAREIENAYRDGFRTFITGCAWGIDIWAGQLVLEAKKAHPDIHLICAMPFPGFGRSWPDGWAEACADLLRRADLVRNVSPYYTGKGVFQVRNKWMVDHSSRLIAYWDGTRGGTFNTIQYGMSAGINIVRGGNI